MLKGIPPLISPPLLDSLARMGHGDVVLVVDENDPAYAAGVPVHRLDGIGVERAIEAVLALCPSTPSSTLPSSGCIQSASRMWSRPFRTGCTA